MRGVYRLMTMGRILVTSFHFLELASSSSYVFFERSLIVFVWVFRMVSFQESFFLSVSLLLMVLNGPPSFWLTFWKPSSLTISR